MSSDNRGLASADEETKERVARAGGEASHGGGRRSQNEDTGMTREEAARKGGEASHSDGRND